MTRRARRFAAVVAVAVMVAGGTALPASAGTATIEGTVFDSVTGDPVSGAAVTATGPSSGSDATDATGFYSIGGLDAGTYSITVAAPCAWEDKTVDGVTAIDGVPVTQDVPLTPDASTTPVTVAVTDASGGGWPLFASVSVTGPGGTVSALTDKMTGVASLDLYPCDTYTVDVSAIASGYEDASVSFSPETDGAALPIGLKADRAACTAPGYLFVGIEETFDNVTGGLPPGWRMANLGGGGGYASPAEGYGGGDYVGAYWSTNDPGYRGNLTGGSGGFASVDVEYHYEETGVYTTTDTTLVSPPVDLRGIEEVWLQFDHDLYQSGAGDHATVLIDPWADSAPAGYKVLETYGSRRTRHEKIDVSSRAKNLSAVRVQFRKQAISGKWWQVDNVRFGGCIVNADGLVVGHVERGSTSTPMIGATVSDAHGNTATTMADGGLGIGDGFYILGSKAGSQALTGTSHGFGNDVRTVNVTDGAVASADFAVPDDQLLSAPYASGRIETATIRGVAGTGPATATATADAASGQLVLDTTASSVLPFGITIPFTVSTVGAAQGHANARIVQRLEVRPGTRTVTASFSFPEQRVEAFAREGHLPPVRGARASLWAVLTLQPIECSGSSCLPTGSAVSKQANFACLPISCGGGATDITLSIESAGYGLVEAQLIVFAMSAVEGNGEATAKLSGNLTALSLV